MNTADTVLAFTLEEKSVRAALIGEEGKEVLAAAAPLGSLTLEEIHSGLQKAFAGLAEALGEPVREIRGLVIHDRLRGFPSGMRPRRIRGTRLPICPASLRQRSAPNPP